MPRDETSGGCPRRRGGARRWRQRRSRGGCRDRRATGRRGGTRSSVSPETLALSSRLQPPTQSTNQPDTPAGSGGLRLIGEAGPTGRVDVRLRSREGGIGIEGRWQAGSVVSCRGKGEEARNRGKRGRNGEAPPPVTCITAVVGINCYSALFPRALLHGRLSCIIFFSFFMLEILMHDTHSLTKIQDILICSKSNHSKFDQIHRKS